MIRGRREAFSSWRLPLADFVSLISFLVRASYSLFRWRVLAGCLAVCLATGGLPVSGVAQAPAPAPAAGPDLTGLYNAAISAFGRGEYQGALDTIDKLVAALPKDLPALEKAKLVAQMEPIYYTRGAAFFNLKQYPQAAEALTKYIANYPKSTRLTEARFSLAEASYLAKDYEAAAAAFAAIENAPLLLPALHERAVLFEGLSYVAAKQPDKAIAAFERLTARGIQSYNSARGAMQLVSLYGAQKQTDKALKTLANLQTNIGFVENLVELNAIALQQGDTFLQASPPDPADALTCYRAVRTKEDVIHLENDRIANLQRQIEATQAAMRATPKDAAQYLLGLKNLQDSVAEDQQLLATFTNLPSIRSKLYYRMARACSLAREDWQAIVAFNDSLNISTDPGDREAALFGLINAYANVSQTADAREASNKYLKEFPQGTNAYTVGYLLGASALQEGDAKTAENYFGSMLKDQPASTLREEMMFLLGNAQFNQGKYEEANAQYSKYMAEFPKGKGVHYEEAYYRKGLCSLFEGKYPEALQAANDYLSHYPRGDFARDAKYRRAVCEYAGGDYDAVIKSCTDWVQANSGDPQAAEVLALLGDAYTATDKTDQALTAYTQSYKAVPIGNPGEDVNDKVLNYSLFEASKILQKQGAWDKVAAMFQEFVRQRPDHPTDVSAAFWIGRADAKLGKVDEAKHFLAEMSQKYIDDPKKDAVEQIIDQLVSLCVRKRRPPVAPDTAAAATPGAAPAASPGASPAAAVVVADTPSPTPSPSPAVAPDPGAELDELLGASKSDRTPTARARILYAKSRLAIMRRQPAESERNLLLIASDYKPVFLSPVILGTVGDFLLSKGKLDQAAPFYQHLLDEYPKSDEVDFAYNGLAEIAFQKKHYQAALQLFQEPIDQGTANQKLKELTVGEAKSYLGLNKLDEAKKLFTQAAAVREWRGETTAFCVYSLGEIEAKQGHWAEANAFYTRVYVGYQRFLPWVAKAYLGSADCLQKLGKPQDAANTLKEMIRNAKLADFTETGEARKRLTELGQG